MSLLPLLCSLRQQEAGHLMPASPPRKLGDMLSQSRMELRHPGGTGVLAALSSFQLSGLCGGKGLTMMVSVCHHVCHISCLNFLCT